MVKGSGFAHERRLEHQVGFDAEIEALKIHHSTVPCGGGESFVDMEAKHFIVVSLEADGHGKRRVDARGPSEFGFRELFTSALNDEFLPKFVAVSQNGFLEINGNFPVLEQASRRVYLDHGLFAEVVKLLLRSCPLGVEVLAGHIVSGVVEVSAKGAPR